MYSIAAICQESVEMARVIDVHLVSISHLLDLLPGEFGRMLFSSSNKPFISLLRFLSAILWLMRSSGVRL
jgi:hypothetical protein